MSKRIAVLTTGRQDYGILRSTVLALHAEKSLELLLLVGGMHLSQRFGRTIGLIHGDQVPVAEEIDFLGERSDPADAAGEAVRMTAEILRRLKPDALLLLGDRYETLAAALAATLCRVPIVHLHGGEETEGAIDNSMRHAITKLSHLHLVSHETHARRVRQMGEAPDTVRVVGAAGLDNLNREDIPTSHELARDLGFALDDPVVVVTVHPTTLAATGASEAASIAQALESVPASYVITQPNADAGRTEIADLWTNWVRERKNACLVSALGERRYWALLRNAAAVVGNSSSGIIEAPALGLPSVNVGDRQKGRLRSEHVQDVPSDAAAIAGALRTALDPDTRARMREIPGVFDWPAAPRIIEALIEWIIPDPPRKPFVDNQ